MKIHDFEKGTFLKTISRERSQLPVIASILGFTNIRLRGKARMRIYPVEYNLFQFHPLWFL